MSEENFESLLDAGLSVLLLIHLVAFSVALAVQRPWTLCGKPACLESRPITPPPPPPRPRATTRTTAPRRPTAPSAEPPGWMGLNRSELSMMEF